MMKRSWDRILGDRSMNVTEVQSWLCQVKTFEQVNWNIDMPNYSAIEALVDPDFMWKWTRYCTEQYDAAKRIIGVVHSTQGFPPRSKAILQPVLTPTQRTFNPAIFNNEAYKYPPSSNTSKAEASLSCDNSSSDEESPERSGHISEHICNNLNCKLHESGYMTM